MVKLQIIAYILIFYQKIFYLEKEAVWNKNNAVLE